MARKSRREERMYAGKTENEWRDWGERFGKLMDQRGREFAEEIEDIGERFGRHMDRKSSKWEKRCKYWWFSTLGFIGPLIGSILGIVFIALGIWVLDVINLPLSSSFISSLSSFLYRNLALFFAAFLFFGYSDYFSKRFPRAFWIISPITTALGIVILIWASIFILNLINATLNSSFISSVSNFLHANLSGIFVVAVVLGYIFLFIGKMIMNMVGD
jgi:hypothetical protein